MRDGLFLVRERTQVNSFALCVVFRAEVYHYLLDMNSLGQLSIENGRKFENLLQVVDHYSRTPDGLLCALQDVCPVTVFEEGAQSRDHARVKHGPRRIESSEIEVFDSLGKLQVHYMYMFSLPLYCCIEKVREHLVLCVRLYISQRMVSHRWSVQ